eukprot:jgi/Tetstr1/445841/TSEL_033481.t1
MAFAPVLSAPRATPPTAAPGRHPALGGHCRRPSALAAPRIGRGCPPAGPARSRRGVLSIASSVAAASMHTLPDGKRLEVVTTKGAGADGGARPPLVFVHGSYHAAWCWQEHFLPFFSELGYDCHAVSLRAQGGSDAVDAPVAGTVDSHAQDLSSFVATLERPPVVVAHSFGGLPLQRYVNGMEDRAGGAPGMPALAGVVFLASVPQTGNKAIVSRYMTAAPLMALKITWWFIRKSFATSEEACRKSFFSDDLPDADLRRYMEQIKGSGNTRMIDLKNMNEIIPLPPPPAFAPPALVLGAELDKVVDIPAVEELAANWGVKPVIVPNIAHDMMLDSRWEDAATAIAAWLAELP